jgi:MoxR-like ATPase
MDIQKTTNQVAAQAETLARIRQEVNKVIVGQERLIDRLIIALVTGGHILLEGVPGLAKTTAVRTLAGALGLQFQRVSFTPDLLPADVIGTMIYNPKEGTFAPKKGPVFTNLLLADEINRAPAKVQSALLEAMQERQVTIGENTYALPEPFLVMATQNPIEQEGTYPLPEAQLDRFMFNIKIDYPTLEEEEKILSVTTRSEKTEVRKILSGKTIAMYQKLVNSVAVSQYIVKYAAALVRATRPGDVSAPPFVREMVDWGAGPRAGQFLIQGGKAIAAMDGRFSVAIEDVQKIAVPVLRHRISVNFQAQAEGLGNDDMIRKLLGMIPTPALPKLERRKE